MLVYRGIQIDIKYLVQIQRKLLWHLWPNGTNWGLKVKPVYQLFLSAERTFFVHTWTAYISKNVSYYGKVQVKSIIRKMLVQWIFLCKMTELNRVA